MIDDLVACCMGRNRERFKRLLIVGTESDIQASNYQSLLAP
jgi:hypothetical protein